MKSVFALFDTYAACKAAVDALLQAEFEQAEMNVLVDEEFAKAHMDVNLEHVAIQATDEVGEKSTGLDILLGVEQPVELPKLGSVYAAGKLATILAKTAAAPESGNTRDILSIEAAMDEFGVPRPQATLTALIDGGLLFWVRTSDERAGKAAELCRLHGGLHVTEYGGN